MGVHLRLHSSAAVSTPAGLAPPPLSLPAPHAPLLRTGPRRADGASPLSAATWPASRSRPTHPPSARGRRRRGSRGPLSPPLWRRRRRRRRCGGAGSRPLVTAARSSWCESRCVRSRPHCAIIYILRALPDRSSAPVSRRLALLGVCDVMCAHCSPFPCRAHLHCYTLLFACVMSVLVSCVSVTVRVARALWWLVRRFDVSQKRSNMLVCYSYMVS